MLPENVAVVIPARLKSTRLPEKLLLKETGKSLIQHTYEAVLKGADRQQIFLAVDDQLLKATVSEFGGNAIMTDPNAASGTDRVAEIAASHDQFDIFVNVQGDEPEIEIAAIQTAVELLQSDPMAAVATLATPIRTREMLDDPACVKVVRAADDSALYFSRSVIPHPRHWDERLLIEGNYLQHIGLYVFRRQFLMQLNELPAAQIEEIEGLEQLRFLSGGHKVLVGSIANATKGIDTRADYDAFVRRWAKNQ